MKLIRLKTTLSALCALAASASLASAAEISDVMKEAMKGEISLYKTVATGKGTPEDTAKLIGYIKELQGKKPPVGEQKAYDEKVGGLLKAAEKVAAKSPGALLELQTAGNCKACHRDHKES